MRSVLMQDWLTVSFGTATSSVATNLNQSREGWLDTAGMSNAVLLIQIPFLKDCTFLLETCSELAGFWLPMEGIQGTPTGEPPGPPDGSLEPSNGYSVMAYLTANPDSASNVRMLRYLRWNLVLNDDGSTLGTACLRISAVLKS